MIDLSSHLAALNADVKRLQELTAKAAERENDPGLRQHLQDLNELMTDSFAKVEETLPEAEASLNQDIAYMSETTSRMEIETAEARQRLAEAAQQAAAAGAVVAAAASFNPQLGKQLRDELIERFAPREAAAAQPGLEDFSVEFDEATSETEAAPAAPAAPAPSGAPLPASVASGMLIFAKVTRSDVVYHPGCGDGRLLISAASRFQASGVGIESDPALVQQALENLRKARLKGLVTIKQDDVFAADYTAASVVFLTMSAADDSRLLRRLRQQLRPGSRIIAYAHAFEDWPPLAETSIRDEKGDPHRLFLWVCDSGPGSVGNITSWEWE